MDGHWMTGEMMVPVMPSGDGMMALSVAKLLKAPIESNDAAAAPLGSC